MKGVTSISLLLSLSPRTQVLMHVHLGSRKQAFVDPAHHRKRQQPYAKLRHRKVPLRQKRAPVTGLKAGHTAKPQLEATRKILCQHESLDNSYKL